jgi:hypothetical protein
MRTGSHAIGMTSQSWLTTKSEKPPSLTGHSSKMS